MVKPRLKGGTPKKFRLAAANWANRNCAGRTAVQKQKEQIDDGSLSNFEQKQNPLPKKLPFLQVRPTSFLSSQHVLCLAQRPSCLSRAAAATDPICCRLCLLPPAAGQTSSDGVQQLGCPSVPEDVCIFAPRLLVGSHGQALHGVRQGD